jgi:hypothetical protein
MTDGPPKRANIDWWSRMRAPGPTVRESRTASSGWTTQSRLGSPGRDLLASSDLFALPIRDLEIEQPMRVVWRSARPATQAAQRLVNAIAT